MIITGGCYKEICQCPTWNALFGSGTRAAAALVGVTPHVELHTYCHLDRMPYLYEMCAYGITIHAIPSTNEIAFAYFHPLSCPGVAPKASDISNEEPIIASGEVVLRFGFLEGDAVVEADRAIYDPQSTRATAPFGANGSSASSLALVLNEDELCTSVGGETIVDAAEKIMVRDNADVVVVKCGVKGAMVFEKERSPSFVPAFRTPRVFKIGSGDVFSAAFAHYWGIEKRSAIDASMLASRSTAAYCTSRELPIPSESALPDYPVVSCYERGTVSIIGAMDTLSNRWLVEEARWCLRGLGRSSVVVNAALGEMDNSSDDVVSALILADTFEDRGEAAIQKTQAHKLPTVVLCERGEVPQTLRSAVQATDDFTTALYWVAWT